MLFFLYLVSGAGMAGVGMCVMHDALHGTYSRNTKLNELMGYTLNLVGGNRDIWKMQHNVLHHSFTNVEEHDDDINAPYFLRFSPHAIQRPLHRFQHLYAWFFYGLSTIFGVTGKDFVKVSRYKKYGLIKDKKSHRKLLTKIIFWKIVYFSYSLVLPVMFSPYSLGMILMAFFAMHFATGLVITLIFQTAHIIPKAEFPLPNSSGHFIKDRWAHQMETTCNFAPGNKTMTWLTGGLNHQIEHHLFPHISHIHYGEISKIVKSTAKEYGIPYHSYPTLSSAIKHHFMMLHDLGQRA
ncbi:acyl-CoA desaturase [Marinilongibacter aquaticus]|uniref:fatty acid desaturase family protein n=1 Tax=Marinilongibacter aquaticus TaxID=2975157 RepID=UPI0021BD4D9C|nr:acyl-CoA desaturase [Marinilongibacter aquaticus]UBM58709.1 acyl-CoA desaturase [Marinilongibacter aquaticus]